jgi:hypothetical protein
MHRGRWQLPAYQNLAENPVKIKVFRKKSAQKGGIKPHLHQI